MEQLFDYRALNYVDLSIIITVVTSTLFGVLRGAVMSIITLIVWIAAIAITYLYGPEAKSFSSIYVKSEPALSIFSYSCLLIISLILLAILRTVLASVTSGLRGGAFDKIFGALFGLIRGALIVVLAFLLIDSCFALIARNNMTEESSEKFLPESITKAQLYSFLKISKELSLNMGLIDIRSRLLNSTTNIVSSL